MKVGACGTQNGAEKKRKWGGKCVEEESGGGEGAAMRSVQSSLALLEDMLLQPPPEKVSPPWLPAQLSALQVAVRTVDPSAPDFWDQVAQKVPPRSHSDCREKFYANHPPPPAGPAPGWTDPVAAWDCEETHSFASFDFPVGPPPETSGAQGVEEAASGEGPEVGFAGEEREGRGSGGAEGKKKRLAEGGRKRGADAKGGKRAGSGSREKVAQGEPKQKKVSREVQRLLAQAAMMLSFPKLAHTSEHGEG